LTSHAADLFYAERVLFVEGQGDVEAYRLLLAKCGVRVPVRVVAMKQTDSIAPNIEGYFRVIELALGPAALTHSLMIVDSDKRAKLNKKWEKQQREHGALQSIVVWTDNVNSNDLEARFVDRDFLAEYFKARDVLEADFDKSFKAAHSFYRSCTQRKEEKGCALIETLYDKLQLNQLSKVDKLASLMQFYVGNAKDDFCKTVAINLHNIESALTKFALPSAPAKTAVRSAPA
jgi:hypothetical protein